jgi:hypothetical protein
MSTPTHDDHPPTTGMLAGHPQARCRICNRWSYLAATDPGLCLSCSPELVATASALEADSPAPPTELDHGPGRRVCPVCQAIPGDGRACTTCGGDGAAPTETLEEVIAREGGSMARALVDGATTTSSSPPCTVATGMRLDAPCRCGHLVAVHTFPGGTCPLCHPPDTTTSSSRPSGLTEERMIEQARGWLAAEFHPALDAGYYHECASRFAERELALHAELEQLRTELEALHAELEEARTP